MTGREHHWRYSETNGFWAHCSCGHSEYGFFDSLLRRRMDRHVREATQLDYLRAQTGALRKTGRDNTAPIVDHDFLPVLGHPDDDECTHRSDGTDATYCGLTRNEHGVP